MEGQDAITPDIHRAIAFEKAAEGLSGNPWLPLLFQDASTHIRTTAIEQGQVSAEEWDTRKGYALRLSQLQGDALHSSNPEQTEAEIDPRAIATLASIYGARVGWERRMGPMPDMDAAHPDKMMAFLEVQQTIEDGDEGLSERADKLHQDLVDQGVTPDQDFARVVQDQYDQFHSMSEVDIGEEEPLDPLTTLESALGQPHAEVINPHTDPLVARAADAAMGWLYHVGANQYESQTNRFDWDPETEQLTIEGEVSLDVYRRNEQWYDQGSEIDEEFVQRLEEHLQTQTSSKPSKAGPAR